MVETGSKVYKSDKLISTIAWKINGKVSYALEGSIFSGGSVLKYLRDSLSLIDTVEESSDIAAELPSNDGVYFVPALTGLGAPYWMEPASERSNSRIKRSGFEKTYRQSRTGIPCISD